MKKLTPRRSALYLGTFDPITLGHLDIINRALRLFDKLTIGIGANPAKKALFSLEERAELIKRACLDAGLKNFIIKPFQNLAVEFAREENSHVLVRGLRTEADYVYEMQMAMMNSVLDSQIETIFIPTKQQFSHISSSMVKEVALLGGDISSLVPPNIFSALNSKRK